MDCINKVTKTHSRVSRSIYLLIQHLQDKKPDEIQEFQDTEFQTSIQKSELELLYSILLNSFPHKY